MNDIPFSTEWEKLKPENRVVGVEFTTVREFTIPKWEYYSGMVGKECRIVLNSKYIGRAVLEGIAKVNSDDLDLQSIQDDTFPIYTKDNFKRLLKRFYGRESLDVIVLYLEWTVVYK